MTNLLLSLVTGALLVLIFPRFNLTFLAPIALTPLIVACAREPRWKRRFLDGWAGGTLFWFFVCVWIQFVLEFHGGMGRWGGWGAFLLFAILKGLHTAMFAALAGVMLRSRWSVPLVAALWAGVEHVHGSLGLAWIGLGFSWLDLGNAAIDWPWLLRLAPITGVHGLSFVLAMASAALAIVILRFRGPSSPHRSGPIAMQLAPLASILLLFLLPALPAPEAGRQPVQVLQTNIDADATWTTDSFAAMEQRFATLSKDEPAPLIVWPEAPAPFVPERPAFLNYISEIPRATNAYLLFTGIAYTADGGPLNSAFMLNPKGEITDRYDKMELVPFGEYVPPAFSFVNRITGDAGDFVPGTRLVTFEANGHRIGTFICYESAFPGLVRQFAAAGAEVLMNLSNDGYFGDSAAREQHLSLARMRAAENARWILRATNNGITAMIDPAGRITERVPEYTETSERMRFNYSSTLTLYTRYGDWFPWSCLAISALAAIALRRASV